MKVGELVVITEGLTAEDTVIIDGLQRSRPGAKVTPERIELAADEPWPKPCRRWREAARSAREGADDLEEASTPATQHQQKQPTPEP